MTDNFCKISAKETIKAAKRTTVVSVTTNAIISTVKIIVGNIANSTALVADGIHSFADMVSDLFSYAMIKVAHSEPDDDHPYGHGKFETIGTLFMALLLALTAASIAYSAIESILHPTGLEILGFAAICGAIVSLFANEFLYQYCKHWGEKVKSSLIIANAWHHRSDSLSSLAALIGITLSIFGFEQADALAALAITYMLLKMAYKIGKEAFNELVDTAVDEETQEKLINTIKETHGTLGAHKLRARLNGGKIFIDVHVDTPAYISASEAHNIGESAELNLRKNHPDISDVVIHIDPSNIQQRTLPENLRRSHVEKTINKHLTKAKLQQFYIHYMKTGIELEILLSSPENIEEIKESIKEEHHEIEAVKIYTLA